jgi:hypothetical protein
MASRGSLNPIVKCVFRRLMHTDKIKHSARTTADAPKPGLSRLRQSGLALSSGTPRSPPSKIKSLAELRPRHCLTLLAQLVPCLFGQISCDRRFASDCGPIIKPSLRHRSGYVSSSDIQRSALRLGMKRYSPARLTTNAGRFVTRRWMGRCGMVNTPLPSLEPSFSTSLPT